MNGREIQRLLNKGELKKSEVRTVYLRMTFAEVPEGRGFRDLLTGGFMKKTGDTSALDKDNKERVFYPSDEVILPEKKLKGDQG